jgi:hypothetical protein
LVTLSVGSALNRPTPSASIRLPRLARKYKAGKFE